MKNQHTTCSRSAVPGIRRARFAGMTRILALLVTIFVTAMSAHAHTISIGYDNSGQGAATFWYGSYHTGTTFTEGTFNLVGVNGNPFPSTTVPFNLVVSTKPSGLIDGVNNFYANRNSPTGLPNLATNTTNLGNVTVWQGVRFTGLAAGSYQFTYIPKTQPSHRW